MSRKPFILALSQFILAISLFSLWMQLAIFCRCRCLEISRVNSGYVNPFSHLRKIYEANVLDFSPALACLTMIFLSLPIDNKPIRLLKSVIVSLKHSKARFETTSSISFNMGYFSHLTTGKIYQCLKTVPAYSYESL